MDARPGKHRLFTIAEANSLVPRVARVMSRLQRTAGQLGEIQRQLQVPFPADEPDPDVEANRLGKGLFHLMNQADHLIEIIQSSVEELEGLGCELKDVPQGLVDFRSVRNGEEIYLCWRLGEDRISHWHTLNTGFSGRQAL